jgi:D-alanyl-D-alanine dipeptidase
MKLRLRILLLIVLCALSVAHATAQLPDVSDLAKKVGAKPAPAPDRYLGLIGEYVVGGTIVIVLEDGGRLVVRQGRRLDALREISHNTFAPQEGERVVFTRDKSGRATMMQYVGVPFVRRRIEPESGNQLHVQPLRPVPELMKEALAAHPPAEDGEFRKTDLVELTKLDPTIRLEIRYATTNNFLGTVFYSQVRAFMQRPAAEAVVRANQRLKALGYGLLIHDAYRPWYVTKVFWDATPDDKKVFVADPSKGSRHNRGCAVDLTLYDLKTGKPIEMVSTYDETTARAYPDYPGGTSLQRWHRTLLRAAMEAEGFTVYEAEWWHFDYQDWRKYLIGNLKFEQIK